MLAGMSVAMLKDPNGHYDILEGAAPVEFLLERVKGVNSTINQSEIPRDLPTFAAFVRGAMRREPSDIIIGECRDPETMGAAIDAAITGHSVKTTAHAEDGPLTMQRVSSLLPPHERDSLLSAVAQALRMVINQRLIPSVDGRRIAIREFLVFDPALRNQFLRTDAKDWPALTRLAIDEKGQSYRKAIERALNAGLINEQTAAYQLRQVA